jgi:hypothetical protein
MASIVQRLASRSITGRDLGTDVHKHHVELLHLFWKQYGTEHCYTHILERKFLEAEEYTLLQKYIYFKQVFLAHARLGLPPLSLSDVRAAKTHFSSA